MQKILVINGPNLNLLGTREPEIYGNENLADVEKNCVELGEEYGVKVDFIQSNIEGKIVEHIQKAKQVYDFIIINPAAFTHTSIAIRDALIAVDLPCYEVHLSNTMQREEFRHTSYISGIALGTISGFGTKGYLYALESAVLLLKQ